MKCPNDDTVLIMSDRQGIEIDYCPQCRGVWLDRGELDKLIDRAPSTPVDTPSQNNYAQPHQRPRYEQRSEQRSEYPSGYGDNRYKKRKKEGFLGDLFDF